MALTALLCALASGCKTPAVPALAGPPADAGQGAAAPHWGELMTEVGHRFERAGRAAVAGRWELAGYDLHELAEVLDDELPHAPRPEDIHTDLMPMARDLLARGVTPLQQAAQARDRRAFDAAFAQTAGLCNGCHRAGSRTFIEVPAIPGASVPTLEAAASAPATATADAGSTR
jgi:hypothetical protein